MKVWFERMFDELPWSVRECFAFPGVELSVGSMGRDVRRLGTHWNFIDYNNR